MRAVILKGPNDLEIVDDWPEPECGPDQVIVKIRTVGICGTDLSGISGKGFPRDYPGIIGHEGGGEIVKVGSEVTDRFVGQRVVIENNFPCMECEFCLQGRSSLCPTKIGSVGGNTWPGLLADYLAAPARFTWPVPDSVPDIALGCIEPLAVGYAAVKRAGVKPGQDAFIIGAGSVGQLVAQSLKAIGAQGWVQDPHEGRVQTAVALGAKVASDYQGEDFPFVFETSGVAAMWNEGLSRLRRGGHFTAIGLAHGGTVDLDPLDIVLRQLTIRGNMIYDHPTDFRATLDALAAGTLVAEAPVEARYTFEQSLEAIEKVRGIPGKSVIEFA